MSSRIRSCRLCLRRSIMPFEACRTILDDGRASDTVRVYGAVNECSAVQRVRVQAVLGAHTSGVEDVFWRAEIFALGYDA